MPLRFYCTFEITTYDYAGPMAMAMAMAMAMGSGMPGGEKLAARFRYHLHRCAD